MHRRRSSDHATALREALDAPIFNRIIKKWVGKGELDYEIYLQTQSLYALQSPRDQQVSSHELMFQIVHQTQELWLKLIANECADLVDDLDRDSLWEASERLERIVRVQRAMAEEIRVLMTLTPDMYQVIRRHLGNGSGQESPGYNQVHLAATAVADALERLMARRNLGLADVYADISPPLDLRRVCEQLADFDEAFQGWLTQHFMLVRRTIGIDREVQALDGFPTTALPARMLLPLFSALWEVRVQLTRSWKREGGTAPGQPRTRNAQRPSIPPPLKTPGKVEQNG